MKFMRKVTALFLALAMILGMTVTVSAIGSTDTGTIQVIGAEPGVSVTAYRLMDVNYDFDNADQPVDPVYEWVDTLAGWVRENYSAYIGTGTDNSVQEAFSTAEADDIAAFYDALAAQIRSNSNSITLDSVTAKADGGAVDITVRTMGNYLVLVENGMNVYSPSAVNLVPVWNDETDAWEMSTPAKVTLKYKEVSVTKTAETAGKDLTASIGDTVNYTVTADVPGYPAATLNDNKTFNIYDTLQAGLTLDEDSIQVTGYVGDTSTDLTAGNVSGGFYTLTTTDAVDLDGTGVSFSLVFDYDTLKDASNVKFDTIRVTYRAVVDKDALVLNSNIDTGNLGNTAKLSYSNNPYAITDSHKDVKDDAKVYTYGIKITKVDSDNVGKLLPGAEFMVSLSENGSDPISFVRTGDGTYRKAVTENETDARQTVIVGAEGGANKGNLTLSGLDVGTYYLTETKAPDGYNKLGSPVEITIIDTDPADGIVNDGADGADGADGYVEQRVENSDGFQLPTTGGIGTVLFTAGGVLLMGLGVIVLVFVSLRRRRS